MIPSLPNPASPGFWIGVVLIALYFGAGYVGQLPVAASWLWSKLPGWKGTTGTTPPVIAVDDDALDLAAFKRLQARYVRLGCKEGQTAMDEAGKHFLHGIGGI